MAQKPEDGGMRGPERSGPARRGPASEPVAGRGGAYSPPPPGDEPDGPGGGSGSRRWMIIGAMAAVLVGGMLYRGGLGGGPAQPPAVEQPAPTPAQVIVLGSADIDQPATDLARKLIAEGSLPAPPTPAPVPAGSQATPAPAPAAAPASAPATAAPAAAVVRPAPAVHRPKRAAGAPKPAAPSPAPSAETEQAVRQVLAEAPAETRAAIASGRQVIYSLHILDDVVEDGDAIEIFVNGTSYGQVMLSNAGQDVLIPLPAGTTARVHVVATQDGGGGVTFGVTTSQGEIRSTVMAVGQSDDWSVNIQ